MAQHDGVIDNGPGLTVRTDINAVIQALISQNSGPIEPTTKYAGQLWLDTTVTPDGVLRQRNQSNTAWIEPSISTIMALTNATGPRLDFKDTARIRSSVVADLATDKLMATVFNAAGTQLRTGEIFDTGNSPSLKATIGYQKLASGVMFNWGNGSTNAGGDLNVSFPAAFTAIPQVTVTVNTSTSTASNNTIVATLCNMTASGCSIQARQVTAGSVVVWGINVRWIAIGY